MIACELHKDDLLLAKSEVEALTGARTWLYGNILIVESAFQKVLTRLAYTRRVFEVFEVIPESRIESWCKSYNFNKHVKTSFAVRVYPIEKRSLELTIAKIIFHKLKNPKVDLKSPGTLFTVFYEDGKAIIGKELVVIDHNFKSRKAHERPGLQPISLHPKLAAAMVNLTGIKSGTILDPCAGTGGLLIEAGLMGLRPVGFDIDKKMVAIAKSNMDFFGIKARIKQADARTTKGTFKYVVADLPYARNTKNLNLYEFYKAFLNQLVVWKTKRAVIGLPDFVDYKPLFNKTGFKVKDEFKIYLHKSLSKVILILESSSP